jgi:hypothetical protein
VYSLPKLIEELYLELENIDLVCDEDEDFNPIERLPTKIFQFLIRLHTLDIFAWVADVNRGSGLIPDKAIICRRRPSEQNPSNSKQKTVWTSRIASVYQEDHAEVRNTPWKYIVTLRGTTPARRGWVGKGHGYLKTRSIGQMENISWEKMPSGVISSRMRKRKTKCKTRERKCLMRKSDGSCRSLPVHILPMMNAPDNFLPSFRLLSRIKFIRLERKKKSKSLFAKRSNAAKVRFSLNIWSELIKIKEITNTNAERGQAMALLGLDSVVTTTHQNLLIIGPQVMPYPYQEICPGACASAF